MEMGTAGLVFRMRRRERRSRIGWHRELVVWSPFIISPVSLQGQRATESRKSDTRWHLSDECLHDLATGKRLAESSTKPSSTPPETPGNDYVSPNTGMLVLHPNASNPFTYQGIEAPVATPLNSSSNGESSDSTSPSPSDSSLCPISPLADQHFLPDPVLSVYAALFINGSILGIPCAHGQPLTPSRSAAPSTPIPLRPTPLQLTTGHFSWIDRFPFPRMRDNMILLAGIIDEEEFLGDLFILSGSFTMRKGGSTWDPEAWRIGGEFGGKWGYLFY
jgi:hypothetical protein